VVYVNDRDIVTITGPNGEQYKIISSGAGRVESKLINSEPYEKKLLQTIYRLGLTGTAFDVGAHIGNHTLWLAAVCGLKVHAWEPFDKSRTLLEESLRLNPELDVTVYDWAAGAETTRGRFTSGLWMEFDPTREGAALTLDRGHVPVRRIDDFVQVDDLAVLKVDVEGMEHDVLAGAIQNIERCRPIIYAEAHTRTASRKVADVIMPLGYRAGEVISMGSPMQTWLPS
jgi:FkbM family methyltransferase